MYSLNYFKLIKDWVENLRVVMWEESVLDLGQNRRGFKSQKPEGLYLVFLTSNCPMLINIIV